MFTTIRKEIEDYDIVISDDPKETYMGFNEDENLLDKGMVRIYCRKDGYYVTFVSSKEMMKYEEDFNKFCLYHIKHLFEKIKKETK
jgi:hypothetical protein